MIRITNVKLSLDESDLSLAASKALMIDSEEVLGVDIVKRSIDARFGDVKFIYTLDVKTASDEAGIISNIKNATDTPARKAWHISQGNVVLNTRPIVVGAGPAGLFAALMLSEYGFKPCVLERGKKVEERSKDVDLFFESGELATESNICFGEGGAGTFSDGKLKTRISDPRCFFVLKTLRDMGAPSDILYDSNAHVGTDILKVVISNIRKKIIENGGEFIFNAKVVGIKIKDDKIESLSYNDVDIDAEAAVFAIGHSARDTYEMLHEKGVEMSKKTFAMGLRIEHPRNIIDKAMYHRYAGHKKLGAANYGLNVKAGNANAYTFCMCPGGVVVNSASEQGMVCVNGMSWHKRDGENSNSALVTQITPEMVKGEHPLAGIEYQRFYEKEAFKLGGGDYSIPAIRVADFLQGNKPHKFDVMPTARPNTIPCDIKKALPKHVFDTLKLAIPEMGKRINGFDMGGAVLSAVETRTSSPVRILRDTDMQSQSVKGLYPVGEGAGYAGGIVSSAVDGLKAAEAIISKFKLVK